MQQQQKHSHDAYRTRRGRPSTRLTPESRSSRVSIARRVPPPRQHADSTSWSDLPHHPAIESRSHQAAAEHLVGYSQADVPLFKRNQLEPVKDLKLLVKDYAPIAKNALTILINISADLDVLKDISKDDAFLELLLSRITVCQFPGAYTAIEVEAD